MGQVSQDRNKINLIRSQNWCLNCKRTPKSVVIKFNKVYIRFIVVSWEKLLDL